MKCFIALIYELSFKIGDEYVADFGLKPRHYFCIEPQSDDEIATLIEEKITDFQERFEEKQEPECKLHPCSISMIIL